MAQSQSARALSSLSSDEAKAFFSSVDTVLVDCDGVLWMSSIPLPGSIEVIAKLKELGKKVFLVSNNSLKTVDRYVNLCRSLGLNVDKEEVIIPSVVIAEYLKGRGFEGKAYVIGSSAMKETLRDLGINFYDAEDKIEDRTVPGLIHKLESLDLDTKAVILDFDIDLNYLMLVQAAILLNRTNATFIVGATDCDVPLTEKLTLLGPGYFRSILESATKRTPIVAGKPSPIVAEAIARRHPLVPERTLMIGDAITQDIQLGNNCGFKTLLVLSGGSKLEDIARYPDNQPTLYTDTLGDILPLLQ